MPYFIGPEGPKSAKLAIVAEKPGRDELDELKRTGTGRPLIGASGRELNRHLSRIGTRREHVYLTNAVKHFEDVSTPTNQDIQRELRSLYRELSNLPNLNCIVALGRVSLMALSNFHLDAIMNRRGSIIPSFIGIKMVPTLHPAFYMRGEWRYRPIVEFDLKRALEQSEFPEIRGEKRTYYIGPTFREACGWLTSLIGKKEISFDIETFKRRYISCIGFSSDQENAFCIPLYSFDRGQGYWSVPEERTIWRLIQQALAQPKTCYITQNGLFDCWHLWCHGIDTPYMANGFDTMYAHRLVAPDLPHTLHFMTSIYTETPYYKDESGYHDGMVHVPDEQFWLYNCKDASETLAVAHGLMADMHELDLLPYYRRHVQKQWDVLTDMRRRGIRVDKDALQKIHAQLLGETRDIEEKLEKEIGWIPNTKSPTQMDKVFTQIGIRPSRTATGRPRMNEDSLLSYIDQFPSISTPLVHCIEINKRRTLTSGFLNIALDGNDFYHPSYDLSHAKTGRLSSSGDEFGGPQLQNIPKRLRHIFIPDEVGHEFTFGDLEQAETRCLAWGTGDQFLIDAFESGQDVHRIRACIIYRGWMGESLPPPELIDSILTTCKQCEGECVHSERYIAKRAGHAFSYGMGARKFVKILRHAGVFISEREARRIRELLVSRTIRTWQDKIANSLQESPWLTNPLGRRREFYGVPDDTMVREALSWLWQSTISHITNHAMTVLHEQLTLHKMGRIVTQTHDSIGVTHPACYRKEVEDLMRSAFDVPVHFPSGVLRIPLDIKHGRNWRDLK